MNYEAFNAYPTFSDNIRAVTALKIKEQLDITEQIKKFKKLGGKIEKIKSNVMDKSNRTAKQNGSANYENDVLNGKNMDKPLKPR